MLKPYHKPDNKELLKHLRRLRYLTTRAIPLAKHELESLSWSIETILMSWLFRNSTPSIRLMNINEINRSLRAKIKQNRRHEDTDEIFMLKMLFKHLGKANQTCDELESYIAEANQLILCFDCYGIKIKNYADLAQAINSLRSFNQNRTVSKGG